MCRKEFVSDRSLLPDPTFDLLISKIYPSRYEYNAHQARVLEELYKSPSQANLEQSVNDGIKIQTQNHLQSTNVKNQQDVSSCSSTTKIPNNIESGKDNVTRTVVQANVTQIPQTIIVSEDNCSVSTPVDGSDISEQDGSTREITSDEIVELVLRLHPTKTERDNPLIRYLNENAVRYIKTTANATVDHIRKYMTMRFAFDGVEILTLLIYIASTTDQCVPLNGYQTLRQVHNKYWKVNKPMEMFYSIH